MEKETSLSKKITYCNCWPKCNKECEEIKIKEVREAVLRLKANEKKLEEALSRFADLNRRISVPLVNGEVYVFGKTIKEYLEIDEIFGEKLI